MRGFGRKRIAFQAIAAIDIALWDLKGKVLDQPIYRLLGPAHESVPIYGSGGWTNYSQDELVAEQVGYVERGIPRVKMKVAKTSASRSVRISSASRPSEKQSATAWRYLSMPTTAITQSRR